MVRDCGRAADGQLGRVSFPSVYFLPTPQNKTAHASCTECRPRRKAKVSLFLFCLKSPLIHYTETFKCLWLG